MPFSTLVALFQKSPYFARVTAELEKNKKRQVISGLWGAAKSLFIASIYESISSPVMVAAQNEDEAQKLYEDLLIFLHKKEKSSGEVILFSSSDSEARLIALDALTSNSGRPVIITTAEALSLKVMAPPEFLELSPEIKVGDGLDREIFIAKLVRGGYQRLSLVEGEGQFSIRGEIIDVWSPNLKEPVRIEFLGDKIESLRQFDPLTQRQKNKLGKTRLIPFKDETETNFSWLKYLSTDTLIISDNAELSEIFKKIRFSPPHQIHLAPFAGTVTVSFYTRPMENFHRHIEFLADRIKEWLSDDYQVMLFCDNEGQKERLKELLEPYTKRMGRLPFIMVGNLSSGFMANELKIAIITDEEIFGRYQWRRYSGKRKAREILSESIFFELKTGDYVVHENYGIGLYQGIERFKIEKNEQDFLVISYDAGDKLYVPMDQLNLVQKYVGVEGHSPRLYRLGGASWDRVKKHVKESVQQMAKELLDLYATREALEGYAFSPDSHWQKEFDAAFIYEETPDQKLAIEEVKKDMESSKPMDRIICGDVGYGKTEVAMRAAFKAVMDDKQVAMLVPTTILAEQHLNTFRERLADYPVTIEMLSRFKTRKEQENIISGLEKGTVDIIIGTHRMIQKDVRFKDLGLIIIDEEQRFGVRHKEKLKQLKKLTDVLTLTATPIPRTLHMSLSGIRNMSIINDPPEGRLPIATYVMEYNEKVIKDAITQELNRQGQVFFVHNRVQSIHKVAEELKKIVPRARIIIAHGQMPEKELERVMLSFIAGEFDIMVATTIIESGLDIPNVNTLIIKDVHDFGLGQLYQLRGRIGRGKHKAYAYLFYPSLQIEPLSEDAIKRLETIQEFTELGAGFKIAMRDLEIRGAGNLLGPQQSGQIMEVGFNLYCQLLSSAVNELKGDVVSAPVMAKVNLDVPAFIPVSYIADDQSRVNIYKKMAGIATTQELNDLKKEMADRFGEYPPEVGLLTEIIELRIMAQRLKILEINQKGPQVIAEFSRDIAFPVERLLNMAKQKEYRDRLTFKEDKNFTVTIREIPSGPKDLVKFLKKILQKLD
jgi:transcription-repair coupling factor (superfamily II helicase)